MVETVRITGELGPVLYTREEDQGTGEVELRVRFQPRTFGIKDALKSLRFWCHMDERTWVLAADRYSPHQEQKLRYLLQHGELPPPGTRLPPLQPAAAAGPTQPQQQQQQQQQQQHPARQTPAAAPHATPGQRERRRPREEPPREREFSDGLVAMRREADGRFLLEGARLRHISQQLERILHFERLPQGLGELPAWRSAWALSGAEEEWVASLLEHRERRLREGADAPDEKDPLPAGAMPARFKPRAADGTPLRGPNTTRNGLPHNINRKFFSMFDQRPGGFLWADGTLPFSEEAHGRFAHWVDDSGMEPAYMAMLGIGGGGAVAGWGSEDDSWEEEDDGGEEDDDGEDGDEEEEDEEGSALDDAEGGASNAAEEEAAEEEEASEEAAEAEEADSDSDWRPGDD